MNTESHNWHSSPRPDKITHEYHIIVPTHSAVSHHNIHVQLCDVALQKKLTWHEYVQLYGLYVWHSLLMMSIVSMQIVSSIQPLQLGNNASFPGTTLCVDSAVRSNTITYHWWWQKIKQLVLEPQGLNNYCMSLYLCLQLWFCQL